MRIISFIEDAQVIRYILKHLGLWLFRSRPPPACAHTADRPKIQAAITLAESRRFYLFVRRNNQTINRFLKRTDVAIYLQRGH
jgi:hypothetical protein